MGTALLHNRVVKSGSGLPDFEYNGEHALIEEEGGWKVRFLSSGTLKPLKNMIVDIFCVGGGGGGGYGHSAGAGGGGGGNTSTVYSIELKKNTEYVVTIGAGGAIQKSGGETSFADIVTAKGGLRGQSQKGGNGGSGGGGYSGGYAGGSDGSDGKGVYPGTGQGSTTREFHESTGDLYAGGGGGGKSTSGGGAGGAGGGGHGNCGGNGAGNGAANTGGGGGGGMSSSTSAAAGGSGIVIIRNARG